MWGRIENRLLNRPLIACMSKTTSPRSNQCLQDCKTAWNCSKPAFYIRITVVIQTIISLSVNFSLDPLRGALRIIAIHDTSFARKQKEDCLR